MAGEGVWPKVDGDVFYGSDANNWQAFGDGTDGTYNDSGNLDQGTMYQYTSFNLSNGQTLTTTSTSGKPIVVLVSGNCTIAGTIDLDGKGYDAGTGATTGQGAGTAGENFQRNANYGTAADFGEGGSGVGDTGAGGGGGAAASTDGNNGTNGSGGANGGDKGDSGITAWNYIFDVDTPGAYQFDSGQGGGGAGAGFDTFGQPTANTGGDGGAGGGSIIFIVGGNLNVTGASITADGANGDNGSGSPSGGGGGGGGGGAVWIIYKGTLTGSVTPTVTAGSGGSGGGAGGNGGAGRYKIQQIQTIPPTGSIIQSL